MCDNLREAQIDLHLVCLHIYAEKKDRRTMLEKHCNNEYDCAYTPFIDWGPFFHAKAFWHNLTTLGQWTYNWGKSRKHVREIFALSTEHIFVFYKILVLERRLSPWRTRQAIYV
jgi:hypothetical protein